MKHHLKLGGSVVMAVIVVVGLAIAAWPHSITMAAFGIDLAPHPAQTVNPGPWVPTALVRLAGVFVALFAAMIFGIGAPRWAGRWVFGSVGVLAIAVAIVQWIEILPLSVGLTVTALCLVLMLGGYVALLGLESHEEAEV